ncbi:hypothetical protein ACFC4G_25030 [Streptomyces sp. NPDC056002]|uniref:hypothetical protein n=1 Tax=unclassified Streptomyces TaxID=2593676 RepID=UPI0035E31607
MSRVINGETRVRAVVAERIRNVVSELGWFSPAPGERRAIRSSCTRTRSSQHTAHGPLHGWRPPGS